MLRKINRISVNVERKIQVIPSVLAPLYDRLVPWLLRSFYVHVAREAAERNPRRVIDVGCGTAGLLLHLSSQDKVESLVGVDLSDTMIRFAQRNIARRGAGNIDLLIADAHMLPLRSGCFNLVLSTFALHHIRRPAEFFAECHRLLAEGGEAWIYEFSYDAPWSEIRRSARMLGRPALLLKLIFLLHGLPRAEYESGRIRAALERASLGHEVSYEGMETGLVIKGPPPS